MSGFLGYALCNSTALSDCDKNIFVKTACKKIKLSHPEYFYFAIVRNPYDRVFSLWSHQMTKTLDKMKQKNEKMNKLKGLSLGKGGDVKKDIFEYSRRELLTLFAEFVWKLRFVGIKRNRGKGFKRSGVSSDHNYEQHWWLFNNELNCPIVDFIGNLENIEDDIEHIINLIPNNRVIMEYYIANGEYWKVNTYGTNIKRILYDNAVNDGLRVESLSDIFLVSANMTGINVKRWASELYQVDFELFGYDMNRIENNLLS